MLLLLACSSAAPAPVLPLQKVAEVATPTGIIPAPGQDGALWVSSQPGVVYEVRDGAARAILDLQAEVASGGETGLLGLATKGEHLFVNYTFRDAKGLHTRIAAFPIVGGAPQAAGEQAVLEFDQPWSNHNSGAMAVGPDGMLYLGVGDGGSGGDPRGTGQRRDDLLGSILRIDVTTLPYSVPADNPFVGQERSEERRVGKECRRLCRSRWSPYH
jgi:glucose/arabinose dehydrogenase